MRPALLDDVSDGAAAKERPISAVEPKKLFFVEELSHEAAAAHSAEWQRLSDDCLEPNVFLTPAFALAAARHLTGRRAPRFLFVWDAEADASRTLVAVCPLAPASGVYRFLPKRLWTHEQAPLGTPLVAKPQAQAALAAIFAHCRTKAPKAGGLMFPLLPQEGPVAQLLTKMAKAEGRALALFGAHQRALLAGGRDPQSYFKEVLSAHRRRNVKRSRKLLEAQGKLGIEVHRDAAALEAATAVFLALENTGWKGRRGTAFLGTPQRAGFAHEALHPLAADHRYFIVSLTLDEKPIAMGLVLLSGTRAFWWKIAYDEAYATYSPGVLLALDLTSVLLSDPQIEATDSCATARHTMIDHLWPERLAIADLFVAYDTQDAAHFAGFARREALYQGLHGKIKDTVQQLHRLKSRAVR